MANTIGVKFLYSFGLGNYNLTNPGANIISVTDTLPGDFDKKNLTTMPLRETWRSANVTGWKEIIIQADDIVNAPDTFAILNHNLTDIAVIEVQGSITPDFTTPAFTLPFVYNEENLVLLQAIGIAYNYYRFRFLDPTNPCGFIEIGRIVAGQSLTLTNNEDVTDDVEVQPVDNSYEIDTEGFFRAFNERVMVDGLTLNFDQFQTLPGNNQNFVAIKQMVKQVKTVYPFLTIVDPSDPYFQLTWGQISTLPNYVFDINRYCTFQIVVQQVF